MGTSTGYGAQILRGDGSGVDGVRASKTYGSGTAAVLCTAVKNGTSGNSITVAFVDPPGNNAPLSIAVSGNSITVNLATDGSSNPISTANQVIAALNSNAASCKLITAKAGDSGGGGVVAAAAASALTGGALATHVFTKLSGLKNFSHEGLSANVVDITAADSPDRTSQKTLGFNNAGSITFEMIFDADDDSQALMESDFRTGIERVYRLRLSDQSTTTMDFRGFVTNFGLSVPLEEAVSRSCTIELTGPVVRNYGS